MKQANSSTYITVAILVVLLLARFTYFVFLLLQYDRLALEVVYILLNYSLITVAIHINKPHLHLLNFDRNSMIFFILLGLTYAIFLYQSVGIILFLMAIYNGSLLSKNPKFADTEFSLKTILLGVLGVLVVLIYFWTQADALAYQGKIDIGSAISRANTPLVFFEEFIFRGILWMMLRKIGLGERWILFIQAVLFGLAHFYFFFYYPVFLFVVIPILGILFGAMVYRSRSIFPSLMFHFVINVISNLLL
jgi:uncharacterized protein